MRVVLNPRIVPVLLVQEGRLVKGVNFRNHTYVGDPMNAVRIFNAKNADELILLDITATRRGTVLDVGFIERVADECYMPFGVGGGIRTVEQMRQLLRAGAEKVVINTAAVEMPELVREASEMFGSSSITVSIDVKRDEQGKERVYTHAGTRKTDLEPVAWAVQVAEQGAGEILLTSIVRDGTRQGYDLEAIKRVTCAVDIPVIACGGAGREEDLYQVIDTAEASAAAAGSLFVLYGPHSSVLLRYPAQMRARLEARSPQKGA